MTARGTWVRAALVLALISLLAGRWGAVAAADRWWADSLGAGATHAAIANLKLMLLAAAFALAAVWSLGNLYLVYRTIGSVHVPRRLGNLEIVEAVPRRYLLYGAVGLGLLIAVILSHGAGDWWYPVALLGSAAGSDVRDPILGRELSYYLFRLPWEQALQGYCAVLSVVMLVVTAALYGLVGAIRVERRRLEIADVARRHLAGLLMVFGLVLALGFRLDPAQYVAGMRGVPYDAVLLEVRLPVSRMLAGVALAAALASLAWVWVNRVALVVVSWAMLAALALGGTFVAPAFSAATRRAERVAAPKLIAAQHRMLALAYGLPLADSTIAPPNTPAAGSLEGDTATLRLAPVWDATTVTDLLNRSAAGQAYERFVGLGLDAYPGPGGRLVPVYVGARTVDLLAAREADPAMTWASAHSGVYSHAAGAVAVSASVAGSTGLPLFIVDLGRPDSASAIAQDVQLAAEAVFFAPSVEDYAVVPSNTGQAGIRPGGNLRRLALAWVLQSPRLLSRDAVPRGAAVLWRRDVAGRLEHYAPFARFGAPWAVVERGRLEWLAWGYVAAAGFPLSVMTVWHGRQVRYLHASLLGRVDAYTGATTLYLVGEDPLSRAWAALAPDLVQPRERIPPALRPHLRYPEELFAAQAALVAAEPLQGLPVARRAPPPGGGIGVSPRAEPQRPFWVVGSLPGDDSVRVRLRWTEERGEPPLLAAVVDGTVSDRGPVLRVERLAQPLSLAGPTQFRSQSLADLDPSAYTGGPVRALVYGGGIVLLRSIFATGTADSALPRLHEVAVRSGETLGRGPNALSAVRDLDISAGIGARPAAEWAEARRWFRRLDAARRSGDWAAFGRAYEQLRRLLASSHDSVP